MSLSSFKDIRKDETYEPPIFNENDMLCTLDGFGNSPEKDALNFLPRRAFASLKEPTNNSHGHPQSTWLVHRDVRVQTNHIDAFSFDNFVPAPLHLRYAEEGFVACALYCSRTWICQTRRTSFQNKEEEATKRRKKVIRSGRLQARVPYLVLIFHF